MYWRFFWFFYFPYRLSSVLGYDSSLITVLSSDFLQLLWYHFFARYAHYHCAFDSFSVLFFLILNSHSKWITLTLAYEFKHIWKSEWIRTHRFYFWQVWLPGTPPQLHVLPGATWSTPGLLSLPRVTTGEHHHHHCPVWAENVLICLF